MRGDGTADGRKSKKLPPGVKALSKSGKGEDKDEMAVLCTEEDSGDVLLRDLHADATELQYALPVTDVKLPYTYAEAMASPEAAMWKEAMDAEMESHRKHGTWELVDRPEGVIIHPQKWVYDVKRHPDGSIRAPKARTVGQGYNQVPGRDFTETYVPMMRSESFRAILAALLPENYIFRQFDIKTAYLHAPLDQPLYVRQPVGYEVPGKVCMLLKGLYGMKQSGRSSTMPSMVSLWTRWDFRARRLIKQFIPAVARMIMLLWDCMWMMVWKEVTVTRLSTTSNRSL